MIEVDIQWLGTYYEIVSYLVSTTSAGKAWPTIVQQQFEGYGKAGLYSLAIKWTVEFENEYDKSRNYTEQLWEFMSDKLK